MCLLCQAFPEGKGDPMGLFFEGELRALFNTIPASVFARVLYSPTSSHFPVLPNLDLDRS